MGTKVRAWPLSRVWKGEQHPRAERHLLLLWPIQHLILLPLALSVHTEVIPTPGSMGSTWPRPNQWEHCVSLTAMIGLKWACDLSWASDSPCQHFCWMIREKVLLHCWDCCVPSLQIPKGPPQGEKLPEKEAYPGKSSTGSWKERGSWWYHRCIWIQPCLKTTS